MHIRKFCALLGTMVCLSTTALADTLTFIAQPGLGGVLDYSWFNSGNWFASDASGNLSPAGRLPLDNEAAVIIGLVDASAGGGIRLANLLATNNAVVANGRFAVLNLQMLSGSSISNSIVNILTSLTVGGTNCLLNATTLTIFGTATGTLTPIAPAPAATLTLSQGSVFQDQGAVSLSDGAQVNGGAPPQSQFVIAGTLSSTNQTLFQGPATNHLVIDNSGLLRVDGGTLRFGAGLDWHSSAGAGEFQAASTNALLLFNAPFHVDGGVTDSFTGPGTNRWVAGATVDGTAQVTGNLELVDSVSGAGLLHILTNTSSGGVVTWVNGTISLPQIGVDAGANLLINGGAATARQLAGSVLNNSGVWSLVNGDVTFSQGAVVSNLVGATISFASTNSVTLGNTNGGGSIYNAGTVRNFGAGVAQIGVPPNISGPDLNNAGLLDAATGEIHLMGGVSSGEFRTTVGAVLWFWGGTHAFNSGTTFTGAGSVRLLQSLGAARWLMNDALIVPQLELGPNGTVDGSGNTSGKAINLGSLFARGNGALSNGRFDVTSCQMMDQSVLTNCTLTILGSLAVKGTNCSLNAATLNISSGTSATLLSLAPNLPATLNLERGSIIQDAGLLTLTDGSQLNGNSSPQNQVVISPGGILSSTNLAYVQGSKTNHLIVNNSGLIRVDGGALRFGHWIDWKSSAGSGEFRAAAPPALILFTDTFHIDAGLTNFFTGAGTNQWLAGATLSGTAQVGATDPVTQTLLPGNLELWDSVSGAGTLSSQAGLLTWVNGTLTQPFLNIGIGGNLLVADGPGTTRYLSGCQVNNSGHWVWRTQTGVLAGSGAVLNNSGGGVLDLQSDITLSYDNIPPMAALNNAGIFLKSGGSGSSSLGADFKNWGSVDIQSGIVNFQGYWVQTAGTAQVDAGATVAAGTLQIQGGRLSGTGTINGIVNNAAVVNPGAVPGILTIAPGKDYQQASIATLKIEIGGHTPGLLYDRLVVGGHATLAGRLQVSSINGFAPQLGDTFEILTCASETGAFSSVDPTGIPGTSWLPRYNGTNVTLVLANSLVLSAPHLSGGSVNMSFPTTPGLGYLVQASDNFTPPNWQTIKTVTGDGTVQSFSDPLTRNQRFYRIVLE